MQTELFVRGAQADNIFRLLGEHENGMTFSLGWAFCRSPRFLSRFIQDMGITEKHSAAKIYLQRQRRAKNHSDITDIEIELAVPGGAHIIIEAKRGFSLPADVQLLRYAKRLNKNPARIKRLAVISEYPEATVIPRLEEQAIIDYYLAWGDVARFAKEARKTAKTQEEKRTLREFTFYLENTTMGPNHGSNLVYVVSLGAGSPEGWKVSWRDIVQQQRKYFHPVRSQWPAIPPNYMGFRYDGHLQFLAHIEHAEIITRPHKYIKGALNEEWAPHYLYSLGPFIPHPALPAGPRVVRSNRVWCELDTLLTCKTISDALNATRKRKDPASR